MNNITISFKVSANPTKILSLGKAVVDVSYSDVLSCAFYYDFREEPLTLRAEADINDTVEITVTECHLSLFVNGALCDEEWPYGNISLEQLTSDLPEFGVTDKVIKNKAVLRKGILSEELRIKGVNIGDCMPFSDSNADNRYHLFWLYDRHGHRSKWGKGAHQWAHASTLDLIHWDEHPMAIEITDSYEGSICTGSTIFAENKFYAWYAVRMVDGSPARVTYSVSDDGEAFVKSGKYFLLPERYHLESVRDPKVIFFENKYHMLITTSLLETGNGCLAHLVSDNADMSNYTDLGPIIEWTDGEQPECPDYFKLGEYYYLVWSIKAKARYIYSKQPFGNNGWITPENNIIDCGRVPKAAFCPWNDELVFAGFEIDSPLWYAGRLVLKKATQNPDGTLKLSQIQ